MVHCSHYQLFESAREQLGIRFVLDCYHIVIFELTGVFISDLFIKKKIAEIFEEKFFFYKEEGVLRLAEVNPHEGSFFYTNFRPSRERMQRVKKCQKSVQSARDKKESHELFKKLNKKFEYKNAFATQRSGYILNKMESEIKVELTKLAKKPDCFKILREKQKNQFWGNIMKRRKIKPRMNRKRFAGRQERGKAEFEKRAKSYIDSKLPKLKKKFKFDCSQVSPPLRHLLGTETIPVQKKDLYSSSFVQPEFSAKDLVRLYEDYQKIKQNKNGMDLKGKDRLENGEKSEDHFGHLVSMSQGAKRLIEADGVSRNLKKKFIDFFNDDHVTKLLTNFRN
jgi:hypothetical protein